MREKSLDQILGDFIPNAPAQPRGRRSGTTLTLWVPDDLKDRYDRLQQISNKRFSKKAREALEALIVAAEKRAG